MLSSSARPLPVAAKGWCACCEREHTLARTPEAEHHALALLAAIEERRRFDVDATEGDPRFSLDVCGASQGKMLGVLTCEGGKVLKGNTEGLHARVDDCGVADLDSLVQCWD